MVKKAIDVNEEKVCMYCTDRQGIVIRRTEKKGYV